MHLDIDLNFFKTSSNSSLIDNTTAIAIISCTLTNQNALADPYCKVTLKNDMTSRMAKFMNNIATVTSNVSLSTDDSFSYTAELVNNQGDIFESYCYREEGTIVVETKQKLVSMSSAQLLPTTILMISTVTSSEISPSLMPSCFMMTNSQCSQSSVIGITAAVTVPITSVITAIVSSLITYYCCIKSKGGYYPSATAPPAVYEIPVSTSGVSSLEMKDNMAYGHVTIGNSGNIPTTSAVYDTVTT